MFAPPSATARRASDSDGRQTRLRAADHGRQLAQSVQAGLGQGRLQGRFVDRRPVHRDRTTHRWPDDRRPAAASPCTSVGHRRPALVVPPGPADGRGRRRPVRRSRQRTDREDLQVATDVPVVDVEPELVEGVRAGHLRDRARPRCPRTCRTWCRRDLVISGVARACTARPSTWRISSVPLVRLPHWSCHRSAACSRIAEQLQVVHVPAGSGS